MRVEAKDRCQMRSQRGRFANRPQLSTKSQPITLCDEISTGDFVPQKVRELVAELERAGFVNRGGKGSHRNFVHPRVSKPITISGALGDDAKHYQIRAVKRAVEESKS